MMPNIRIINLGYFGLSLKVKCRFFCGFVSTRSINNMSKGLQLSVACEETNASARYVVTAIYLDRSLTCNCSF